MRFSRTRLSDVVHRTPVDAAFGHATVPFAGNRRAPRVFAARYSARWSCRAALLVLLALSAFTSAYPLLTRRRSTAPSLQSGSVVHSITSTMGRSDSRSALLDFVGSRLIRFDAPRPPTGGSPPGRCAGAETGLSCSHDSCLTIPRPVRRRILRCCNPSSSHLPWPSPGEAGLGFRLCLCRRALRRGRLHLMLRTGELHPPKEGVTPRSDARISPDAGGLLQRWLGPSFDRTCTGKLS